MRTALRTIALTLTLAACSPDSTGTTIQASRSADHEDDAPSFSDWSAPINLGPPINTAAGQFGAFITKDGLSLYFTCDLSCPDRIGGFDIFVSRRASVDEPWGPPQNVGPNINSTADDQAPTITIDGHWMIFTSSRPGFGAGDLWISRRQDKRDDFGWEPPVNLGSPINTAAVDAGGVLFEDEDGTATLYFVSDRPGGLGLNDIYASTRNADGTFGAPVLVAELSTSFVDQQPAIRRDGLEMFIGSNRPGGGGLTDLWVSTRASTGDPWSTPVNLGPAVNGAGADGRPALSFKATELYFQSVRPGGFGAFDLYVVTRSKLKEPD